MRAAPSLASSSTGTTPSCSSRPVVPAATLKVSWYRTALCASITRSAATVVSGPSQASVTTQRTSLPRQVKGPSTRSLVGSSGAGAGTGRFVTESCGAPTGPGTAVVAGGDGPGATICATSGSQWTDPVAEGR